MRYDALLGHFFKFEIKKIGFELWVKGYGFVWKQLRVAGYELSGSFKSNPLKLIA